MAEAGGDGSILQSALWLFPRGGRGFATRQAYRFAKIMLPPPKNARAKSAEAGRRVLPGRASQSLEGYTNPEMRHLPSKQVRYGAAATGPVVEERFASTKGRETEEPAAAAAVAEKDRCIIFDVGTGEAKAITCSYVNGADGKHAVRVEDLPTARSETKNGGEIARAGPVPRWRRVPVH